MSDLKQRFGSLDALDAPDLWTEAELRSSGSVTSPPERPGRRWLSVAVAFAVAAAGIGFAARAFLGGHQRKPATESPVPPASTQRVAFVANRQGGNDIYVMNLDGTGLTKFVEGRDPSWSPDGSQIAFRTGNPDKGGGLETKINLIDADGTDLRTITPDTYGEPSGEAGPPVWSPDGSEIAFDTLGGIYVMAPDGSDLQLVSQYQGKYACYDLEPSWSPDGSKLVFAVLCDGGNDGIWVVNADGTGKTQLAAPDRISDYWSPAWSPDGTRIAFVGVSGGPAAYRYDLYVMNPDGSDVRKLTDGSAYPSLPAWSPDGSKIAYTENQQGNTRIFLMDADGTNVVPLATSPTDVCCLAWAPAITLTETPATTPTEVPSSIAGARVAATIDVSDAGSVAYGEGSVWVAQRSAPSFGGSILRVDPATNEVVATILVDTVPQWETGGGGLTVANGSVWAAGPIATQSGSSEAAVVQIDPATNFVVDTIRLGGLFADDVAVGPDGSIWVLMRTDAGDPEVVELDPTTHAVIARVRPANGSAGRRIFAADGGALVDLTSPSGGAYHTITWVTAINPSTGEILASSLLRMMPYAAMAEGDGHIWAATGRSLEQIDPATGKTIFDPANVSNTGDVLAVGDGRVWFLDPENRGVLHGYDPVTGTVDVNVDLGKASTPIAIATSPGSVWVLDYEGTLTRVELG